MKLKMKLLLCGILVLLAAASLAAVLGSLGVLPVSGDGQQLYVLREYDGCVAVFAVGAEEAPAVMTDIPVKGLPAADRLALAMGVEAEDYARALLLLEDYGS